MKMIDTSLAVRKVSQFAETEYDLAIVGGGIIGTGVARDAAMRSLKTILFEKEDFCYGTSSRSTRLIHGGLRYLEMYDFGLVREGLREREILLRIARHLVNPLRFLIPVYENSLLGRMRLKLGMILYDVLSYDKSLPSHKYVNKREALEMEPALEKVGLHGAFVYYDCQIALTERLCIENVISAMNHGAIVLNHAKVVGFCRENGGVRGVKVKDMLSGDVTEFRAKLVVNVGGPWLDMVAREVRGERKALARTTKGIHFVTPKVTNDAVATLTSDKRLIFVVPWLGFSLVGTTDTDYTDDMDSVKAENTDVTYLQKELQKVFPGESWKKIIYTIAGVRSLLRVEGLRESAVTRRHTIYDHKQEGLTGLISVIGGKLTAYRSIAQDIVDKVCDELGVDIKSTTAKENLPGANPTTLENARLNAKRIAAENGISEETLNHLTSLYGSRYTEVLGYISRDPLLREPICERNLDIEAEIVHAIERESALTLSDFMLRRSMIGYRECEGLDCCSKVAKNMSKILDWNEQETSSQIDSYKNEIALRHAH